MSGGKGEMIPTRHEPDQTSLGGAGPAVVVAGGPARPVCRFRRTPGPAVNHLPAVPKRQRTGALQNASRGSGTIGQRASILECGGPPPLFSAKLVKSQVFIVYH